MKNKYFKTFMTLYCTCFPSYKSNFIIVSDIYTYTYISLALSVSPSLSPSLPLSLPPSLLPSLPLSLSVYIYIYIGIHSMQGSTANARHGVTRKRSTKRLKHTVCFNLFVFLFHTRNLFRRNPQLIGVS